MRAQQAAPLKELESLVGSVPVTTGLGFNNRCGEGIPHYPPRIWEPREQSRTNGLHKNVTRYIEWSAILLLALAVTGLLATAAAFTVQAWAQQHTNPTRTALILALEPVFAWATSWVATGEILVWRAALGAMLILAGILTVELKPIGVGKHL